MDNLEKALAGVGRQVERNRAEYGKAMEEMRRLKAAGLIYAGTHYKAGKYLYLVYPTSDDGSRKREYVGANSEKIKKALEGIERGVRYKNLETKVETMVRNVMSAMYYAQTAERSLE